MDARLQIRIQRYGWDAAAAFYHDGWQAQLRPAHDTLLLMAGLAPGQKIIETACGSGLITVRIAEVVGNNGRVLATDLSEGMLQDLKARLDAGDITNVDVARMGAEELDVPEGAFDAAICALGLMYTPNPPAALAEMVRVVRPRGVVAATVWGERRNCGWAEVFPIVDARVASEVCPMFFATGAKGALAKQFHQAGLVEIRELRQSETLSFGSDDEVVNAVLLGGPVAMAARRFSREVWSEVRQEFLSSIAAFKRADGGYDIPGEFVTVTGIRPR